jgi:hypothetical protein
MGTNCLGYFEPLEIFQNSSNHFFFNIETPWELLLTKILWHTWCQHCEYDLRQKQFHLGKVLLGSWQMTIKVRMEARRDIKQHSKNLERMSHLETKMTTTWTTKNLFASFQGSMESHPSLRLFALSVGNLQHRTNTAS